MQGAHAQARPRSLVQAKPRQRQARQRVAELRATPVPPVALDSEDAALVARFKALIETKHAPELGPETSGPNMVADVDALASELGVPRRGRRSSSSSIDPRRVAALARDRPRPASQPPSAQPVQRRPGCLRPEPAAPGAGW